MNQIYLNIESSILKNRAAYSLGRLYKAGLFPSQTVYQVCDEDQEIGQGIVIFSPPDLKDFLWVGEMSEELAAWLGMSRSLPRR